MPNESHTTCSWHAREMTGVAMTTADSLTSASLEGRYLLVFAVILVRFAVDNEWTEVLAFILVQETLLSSPRPTKRGHMGGRHRDSWLAGRILLIFQDNALVIALGVRAEPLSLSTVKDLLRPLLLVF